MFFSTKWPISTGSEFPKGPCTQKALVYDANNVWIESIDNLSVQMVSVVRRLRLFRGDPRYYAVVQSSRLLASGKEDASGRPVFDGGRRARLGGYGERRPRFRHQVLHGGGQLGYRRKQHAYLLPTGPYPFPQFHPYPQA